MTHTGGLAAARPSHAAPRVAAAGRALTEAAAGPGLPRFMQAKLPVSQPGDPYEQEADRVADQVLAASALPATSHAPPSIQRFMGQASTAAGTAPASVDRVLASSGRPLDAALQQDMAQRFGQDFSRVRVHSDGAAEQSARDVNAHAYSAGHNIVFGAGRFAPQTHEGQRLIAHELTHVVQQSGADGIGLGDSNHKPGLSPVSPSRLRVHTDQVASRSAEAVAAQAYSVGSDIVFGAGRYASASRDGQRLLAHELAHVQQQSGPAPMIFRQPKPPTAPPSVYPEWKPADAVVELRWLKGNDWEITLSGRTSLESARAILWPKWMPSTVTMIFNVAITDPIERGWFTISGLEAFHLEYMEPSIAAIFRDHGVVDDTKDSPELATARDAFRKNNSDLREWMQSAIHVALKRATRANADLMLAFYRYYSSHGLERDDMSGLGDTSSGDTEISERVLMLEKNPKLTSDPLSLLGSTLIHEFVHTPQGPKEIGGQVTQLTKEAKAYAIELLFSERMGDTTRAADIEKQWLSNDSVIMRMRADKVFNRTYTIISKLYEIIDSKGGTEAATARQMSVEFISKNDADYGGELRDFISKN